MAAMYACTGASPSPFAICGLPPERSFGFADLATGLADLAAFAATHFAGRLLATFVVDFLDVLLAIVLPVADDTLARRKSRARE
jgi:hypothetical protein